MTTVTQKIPSGYKQTEIGVIPADWDVKQLGDLFEITSSKRVFQSEWKTNGIPFYRARELAVLGETGKIDNDLFISSEMYKSFKNTYGVPQKGDILVTGVGTLGKVYVVAGDHDFYFKDGNIIWFKIDNSVNSEFLNQLFLTRLITKQIEDASAGTTVGTYTISGAKKTLIPFPLREEQDAMAKAFYDIDLLISKQQNLIEKKKNIKQGAMQELLTGKLRLPEFSGKWETKKLGEVANVVGGGTPNTSVIGYWNGDINWFTPTEIGFDKYVYESRRKITVEGLKNSSAKILDEGTILLTSRAGIGDLAILKVKACTNQGFQSLVPINNTDSEFLYYLMLTKKDALLEKASGSTFLEISPNNVRAIELMVPDPIEQTAIANVLSDMDIEIEKLESQLTKYQNIKQGMMQTLLTGKIRLLTK